jgi:isopenicillin-N epimerase
MSNEAQKGNPTESSGTSSAWLLDPDMTYLNHGSFGSCPRPVVEFQRELRERLERSPVQFMGRDLEAMLDNARGALAAFVGAGEDNLVFVHNATSGINTVLRSLQFKPDDELLITNQAYGSCRAAANFVAEQTGASVVVAEIPFPLQTADEIVDAVLAKVTSHTRIALLDHVTSPTALILPLKRLIDKLSERGIDTLVDGAHAPGMLPLQLEELGAAYYTGNCHKWLCCPKGAAFLFVRHDRQEDIRPLAISFGVMVSRPGRPRFVTDFNWNGTVDPTAWLSIPEAIRVVGGMVPGGLPEVMRHNHELALTGRRILCDALGSTEPCPDSMVGSMASVLLPDSPNGNLHSPDCAPDSMSNDLVETYQIEVPLCRWPARPKRQVRISAQLYNKAEHYETLSVALQEIIDKESNIDK